METLIMQDGYTDLPPGKLASVVTYLEMRTPPPPDLDTARAEFAIRRVVRPDPDWYLALYRAIGEPWLWFGRLRIGRDELTAIIRSPAVDVFSLSYNGVDDGLLECDRRQMPDIEISYFGVIPALIGKGLGRVLLDYGLRAAWEHHPRRVWLHTCSLDHPRALTFYQRFGFVPYKRAIQITDDPRLRGELPRDAAPDVPIL